MAESRLGGLNNLLFGPSSRKGPTQLADDSGLSEPMAPAAKARPFIRNDGH